MHRSSESIPPLIMSLKYSAFAASTTFYSIKNRVLLFHSFLYHIMTLQCHNSNIKDLPAKLSKLD